MRHAGPWVLSSDSSILDAATGNEICDLVDRGDEVAGRLIAAAPELLAHRGGGNAMRHVEEGDGYIVRIEDTHG